MLKNIFFILVAVILFKCSNKTEVKTTIATEKPVFSNQFYFKEIDQSFGFNDYGFFDTSYQVQYFGMCSFSNTSNLRFSNSAYNCEDTFGLIYDNVPLDTFLNMDFTLTKVNDKDIDSLVYKKSINRARTTYKAQGSDFNPAIAGMFNQQGIIGLHYGTVDSSFANKMYVNYNARFILDSIELGVDCQCYAIDCMNKLEDFEKIVRSLRIK